jgi:hypothetical protein
MLATSPAFDRVGKHRPMAIFARAMPQSGLLMMQTIIGSLHAVMALVRCRKALGSMP